PLGFIGFNGVHALFDANNKVEDMVAIQALTELAVHTSDLIHETQKERGYTAGFLKSDGKLFQEELPTQRRATDSKIEALHEFLEDFKLQEHGTELSQKFSLALEQLDSIQAHRTAITGQSVGPGEAIAYYTDLHRQFLVSIAAFAHRGQDADLARSLNSFAIFLEGKERAGIERALMSGALASHSLQGSDLKKLAEVVAKQNEYFLAFERTSSAEEWALLEQAMQEPAARHAETMVSETFRQALDASKRDAFDQLIESLALTDLLGQEDADGDLKPVLAHLQAYSKLGNLSESEQTQLASLASLFNDVPGASADPDAKGTWSGQVSRFLSALSASKASLVTEWTAPVWFDASTARIGLLKEVESGLADGLRTRAREHQEQAQRAMLWNGLLSAFSLLLVAASGIWIFRSVMKRIYSTVLSIDRVDEHRDLSNRIHDGADDELSSIATSFDKMIASMQDILLDVDGVSKSIAEGAMQVGESSKSLAVGATEQAASLQSISSQVADILLQTKNNAERAQSATELAKQSEQSAGKGMEQMIHMSSAMDEISASSDRIAEIIQTIDDLAFQTNLLALNAAVEAARAGEAGKGFAVVAEEVRSLAQRSAQAARDTSEVITESTQCAVRGVSIASQARDALEEISQGTNQVNEILGGIANASMDQTRAIDGVNRGLTELDEVTQYNAAHSEELAAAADQTSAECNSLQALVGQFQLGQPETKGPNSRSKPANPPNSVEGEVSVPSPANYTSGALESAPTIQSTSPIPEPVEECATFDDAQFDSGLESF
ncbi:MAG: methyl-accepting chemotaxis protein, partial [Planctomycetota bacterium]|nr:methyl-accepting chemotaxis protein [Planctomycetota bacterium]